jgi:hypothetical protein
MSRKTCDMTDLEVFASDCQELAAKIAAAIASGRKKPVTGTWKQIEKRLDEAANTLFEIWHDIEGDQ